jgi:hypothetical protein
MPLITHRTPRGWEELEDLVRSILNECGMNAQRGVTLQLPRGSVDVDVLADETVENVTHRIVCECKDWQTNIPREVVHAFRTVMQETGAHRGYVISRVGFQRGAVEAAASTNIELVTFAQFQEIYFEKWMRARMWAIENEAGDFNVYYEPLGKPGYGRLENDEERTAYNAVWNRYLFAGLMLIPFSPYMNIMGELRVPDVPFDVSELDTQGIAVPDDIRNAGGYRELLALLERYAREGLRELRAVNPITRGRAPEGITRDD